MSRDASDRAWMLNAVITGCATVVWFRLPDPDEAQYAARHSFLSHLDYAEWKPGTERPVVVAHRRKTIHSSSYSDMAGEHRMEGHSRSHARAYGSGSTTAHATSSGSGETTGDFTSYAMTPPLSLLGPNAPDAAMVPTILGQGMGVSNSQSSFEQETSSTAESQFESQTDGEAQSWAHGTSSARSFSDGTSEAFVSVLEWLPSQVYSLPEQLARAAAAIQSLPPREVVIKLGGAAPVRARTSDLPPAFKSPAFKDALLPVFYQACASRSPYLLPVAEVDKLIAERASVASPPRSPEPDFLVPEPSPLPIVDAPEKFAADFVARKRLKPLGTPPLRKPKPKQTPPGRMPAGVPPEAARRFRIIDGDGEGDGDKTP